MYITLFNYHTYCMRYVLFLLHWHLKKLKLKEMTYLSQDHTLNCKSRSYMLSDFGNDFLNVVYIVVLER